MGMDMNEYYIIQQLPIGHYFIGQLYLFILYNLCVMNMINISNWYET